MTTRHFLARKVFKEMHAIRNIKISSKLSKTRQIVATSNRNELQSRNRRAELLDSADQTVCSLISLRRIPPANRQDDPSLLRESRRFREASRRVGQAKKIRVQRPGKPADLFRRDALHLDELLYRVATWSKHQICPHEPAASKRRKGFPDFNAMSHHNCLQVRGHSLHPIGGDSKIGMGSEDDVRTTLPEGSRPCNPRNKKVEFLAPKATERESLPTHIQRVQARRVVKAQKIRRPTIPKGDLLQGRSGQAPSFLYAA